MAGSISRYGYRTSPAREMNAASTQLSRGAMPSEFQDLFKRTLSDLKPRGEFDDLMKRSLIDHKSDAGFKELFKKSLSEFRSSPARSIVPLMRTVTTGVPAGIGRFVIGKMTDDLASQLRAEVRPGPWIKTFQYGDYTYTACGSETRIKFASGPNSCGDVTEAAPATWASWEATALYNLQNPVYFYLGSWYEYLSTTFTGHERWRNTGMLLRNTLNDPYPPTAEEAVTGTKTSMMDETADDVPPYVLRPVVTRARVWLGWGDAAYEWPTETKSEGLPPHVSRRPNVYEREQKRIVVAPVWWSSFINALTETDDFLDAALDAIPDANRRLLREYDGRYTTYDKAQFVFDHWDEVDFAEFLQNLVLNQVEDFLLGRLSKKETENMRLLFEQFGVNFARQPSTTIMRALKGL